jgi:hypothetical protein
VRPRTCLSQVSVQVTSRDMDGPKTGAASRVVKWMSTGSGRRPRTRAAPRLLWLDEQRESHTVAKVPPPKKQVKFKLSLEGRLWQQLLHAANASAGCFYQARPKVNIIFSRYYAHFPNPVLDVCGKFCSTSP